MGKAVDEMGNGVKGVDKLITAGSSAARAEPEDAGASGGPSNGELPGRGVAGSTSGGPSRSVSASSRDSEHVLPESKGGEPGSANSLDAVSTEEIPGDRRAPADAASGKADPARSVPQAVPQTVEDPKGPDARAEAAVPSEKSNGQSEPAVEKRKGFFRFGSRSKLSSSTETSDTESRSGTAGRGQRGTGAADAPSEDGGSGPPSRVASALLDTGGASSGTEEALREERGRPQGIRGLLKRLSNSFDRPKAAGEAAAAGPGPAVPTGPSGASAGYDADVDMTPKWVGPGGGAAGKASALRDPAKAPGVPEGSVPPPSVPAVPTALIVSGGSASEPLRRITEESDDMSLHLDSGKVSASTEPELPWALGTVRVRHPGDDVVAGQRWDAPAVPRVGAAVPKAGAAGGSMAPRALEPSKSGNRLSLNQLVDLVSKPYRCSWMQ